MRKLTHAEIAAKRKSPEDMQNIKRNPIYGVCDNIRSIFNVGAIFRTSDGALIEKLYLTGYTPYPPRKEIEKVALGATETVPWEYRQSTLQAVEEIRSMGVKIAVLEITDAERSIWTLKKPEFPMCIVVGNEISGVSKEIIDIADTSLEIPMLGMKQSLNVSVAYSIAVYEMLRVLTDKQEGSL
ncbi:MAG: RNA methyltransferase [Ignavibacteria bacterium]|jgi:tRNA G18 (ribose-2'-O)-methylase SpoU|nr:RNA methyltransferase [Ignavibacteria bacterium]